MFSHGAERRFVVLSPGHLILLIILEIFQLYTGAADRCPRRRRRVCGILSFRRCVNRGQVPLEVGDWLKGWWWQVIVGVRPVTVLHVVSVDCIEEVSGAFRPLWKFEFSPSSSFVSMSDHIWMHHNSPRVSAACVFRRAS